MRSSLAAQLFNRTRASTRCARVHCAPAEFCAVALARFAVALNALEMSIHIATPKRQHRRADVRRSSRTKLYRAPGVRREPTPAGLKMRSCFVIYAHPRMSHALGVILLRRQVAWFDYHRDSCVDSESIVQVLSASPLLVLTWKSCQR